MGTYCPDITRQRATVNWQLGIKHARINLGAYYVVFLGYIIALLPYICAVFCQAAMPVEVVRLGLTENLLTVWQVSVIIDLWINGNIINYKRFHLFFCLSVWLQNQLLWWLVWSVQTSVSTSPLITLQDANLFVSLGVSWHETVVSWNTYRHFCYVSLRSCYLVFCF